MSLNQDGARKKHPAGPGRPKGSRNKLTIERERMAIEALKRVREGPIPARLAKDMLSEIGNAMHNYAMDKWNDPKIKKEDAMPAMLAAADILRYLAPYQSPRMQSVTVHRVDPYDGMSDDQLYSELCRRAQMLGVKLPSRPKLITGKVIENDDADS